MASFHNAQMVQNQTGHQTIHGDVHFYGEDTIHRQQRHPARSFNLGLHLTEAPIIEDDFFVGRSAELQEMENALQPQGMTQTHRRLVVGGMGGVEAVLKQSIRYMAQHVLDVEELRASDDDQLLVHVMRWLSDIRNTRWMLIFDNYDDPETYRIERYCPYGAHGSAIITTRVPDQVQGQRLTVRPMENIQQSLDILAARSGRAHVDADPHARDLARRMQGLPLALATVGAYLKHSPWTFQEYLEIYERQFNIDDNGRPLSLPEYQDRTLYTTWNVTYKRLEADHPKAARLLRSLAFFDNQHLQHQMFRVSNDHSVTRKLAKTRSRLQALLRAPEKNGSLGWLSRMSIEEFESAMYVLTKYCFVEARSGHKDYSIHSCVHDWALSSQVASTRSEGYWFAFDRVADAVNDIALDCYAYAKHSTVTPHAIRLTHTGFSTVSQDTSRRRLDSMHDIAEFLRQQVQLGAAERMYLRALAGKEEVLGPDHTSTLYTVNNLGILYFDQGKLDKAEQMYERVLTGFRKALNKEHPWRVGQMLNFTSLLIAQRKPHEAVRLYQQIIAIHVDRQADATSRFRLLVDGYVQALSNSVSILRDIFVDAQPYLLRLIEHVRLHGHGHGNMVAIRYLAKALLHLQDDENAQRVWLYCLTQRHCETPDFGWVRCDACHRRLNTTMGINICRSCVDTNICDRCLSTKMTNVSIAAYCEHNQFHNFGTTIRQVLRSSSSCDPAEVEEWMNALQQRYQSVVD